MWKDTACPLWSSHRIVVAIHQTVLAYISVPIMFEGWCLSSYSCGALFDSKNMPLPSWVTFIGRPRSNAVGIARKHWDSVTLVREQGWSARNMSLLGWVCHSQGWSARNMPVLGWECHSQGWSARNMSLLHWVCHSQCWSTRNMSLLHWVCHSQGWSARNMPLLDWECHSQGWSAINMPSWAESVTRRADLLETCPPGLRVSLAGLIY